MFWEVPIGTFWPRSNSFEFNAAGERAVGAKIYFFDAGTSTPRATYSDAALSTANAHPVVADGNGRWPQIFLQFGSYHEHATTSGGTTLWETDDIPNPEPTDPGEGVDANSIFQTGDFLIVGKNGTRTGFVRCNGRTIGNAASGGTERANADTVDLFTYIYDNYANGQAAVSGGRGASAAADYAANKTIAMPNYQGAALVGFDDMGATAGGFFASAPVISGSGILSGSLMGANTHTILTAQLPVTTPAGSINQVTGTISQITPAGTISQITPAGSVSISDTRTWSFTYSNTASNAVGGSGLDTTNVQVAISNKTVTVASGSISGSFTGTPVTPTLTGTPVTPTFTGSTPTFTGTPFGSGTAHNIMARSAPVTVLMKL